MEIETLRHSRLDKLLAAELDGSQCQGVETPKHSDWGQTLGNEIQRSVLDGEPQRRSLADPPMLDYTFFESYYELQKEVKNDPRWSVEDLKWSTGFVDIDSEKHLFYTYRAELYGRVQKTRSEGLTKEVEWRRGLCIELGEESKELKREQGVHIAKCGEEHGDWNKMDDLLRFGRDDEGHIFRRTALYDAGGKLITKRAP